MDVQIFDSYEKARDFIKDGDLVFVCHENRLIPKLISIATRSIYSHVGIAFWAEINNKKRLMIIESQGFTKRRILNMSYYSAKSFHVLSSPRDISEYIDNALETAGKVKYGYIEAAYVGIREFLLKTFNLKLPFKQFEGEICSEFVARQMLLPETNISPGLLWDILIKKGVTIRLKVHSI